MLLVRRKAGAGNVRRQHAADCHLHDYSKAFKPSRKVGHATVRSQTAEQLQQQITELEKLI